MTSSLVRPDLCPADRFEYVLNNWTKICGGSEPRFNNSVYLSELGTADRNFALAYFMKEHGTFPKGADLQETLEFYFQCCSIDPNCRASSSCSLYHGIKWNVPFNRRKSLQCEYFKKCTRTYVNMWNV